MAASQVNNNPTESEKCLTDARKAFATKLLASKPQNENSESATRTEDVATQNWGFPPKTNGSHIDSNLHETKEKDEDESYTKNCGEKEISNTAAKLSKDGIASRSSHGLLHLSNFHDSSFNLCLPPTLCFCSDLDHTLIGRTSDQKHDVCDGHLQEFNKLWLTKYAPQNCVLVYATGRTYKHFKDAAERWSLLKPDILVCQDGCYIYWLNRKLAETVQKESTSNKELCFKDESSDDDFVWKDGSWDTILSDGWNQAFMESIINDFNQENGNILYKPELPDWLVLIEPFRVGTCLTSQKSCEMALKYIEKRVKLYNKQIIEAKERKNNNDKELINIHTYFVEFKGFGNLWGAIVTPHNGGKGNALHWLRDRLHIKDDLKSRMIVCGDSGNDISMLKELEYNSVVMGNSASDLLDYWESNKQIHGNKMIKTKQHRTLGVIEGLEHFAAKILGFEKSEN